MSLRADFSVLALEYKDKLTCSIRSNVEAGAMVAGASSMIFWCLLWMEQSRPKREMAFPYMSPSIWTSRCLAC